MLTETSKDYLREKINEIQKLLASDGLASRITIETASGSGSNPLTILMDNGFWTSSSDNNYDGEIWQPSSEPYYQTTEILPVWDSSYD